MAKVVGCDWVQNHKSMIKFMKGNPQAFYMDTLTKIIYNSHPWMSSQFPSEEEFDNLSLEKSLAIYNQVFGNADGMHFTFVGNIDPAVVNPLLIKYLGSLPAQPTAHNFKDNGVRPVKGVVEANIKKGKEAKSMINLFWSGETEYSTKESMTLRALVEVLNIQITEKLREEMCGMYSGGLQGGMQKRPYAHYEVMAVIPTGPDKVEKLSAALMELITTARKKGIEQQ